MTLRSFFKYHHNQKMIELLAVELSEVIERRHLDSVQSAIVYVQDHAFFPNDRDYQIKLHIDDGMAMDILPLVEKETTTVCQSLAKAR